MTSKCSVCLDARRPEIDAALRDGAGRRTIARKFGVSADAAGRHQRLHLDRVEPAAPSAPPAAHALSVRPPPAPIMVVAAVFPFNGVTLQPGDFVRGQENIDRKRAAGVPMRHPVAADLKTIAELDRRSTLFPAVPEPQRRLPDRPAGPLLPADLAESELAREINLRPELLARQAERAAVAFKRAALIGDHVTVERMAMTFRREAGMSGSLPGQYRAWVAAEEWAWSYDGADKFLAAEARRTPVTGPAVAFDPQGFLARLRTSGVDLFVDDSGAMKVRGRLHPPDDVLLSVHKATILDFLKTAREVHA